MDTLKTTLLLFPVLLLLALPTNCSPVAPETAPEAVRDIEGDKLRKGKEYYILPVVRGKGGGLTLTTSRNGSCPLDVAQKQQEVATGLPLTLAPVDPKKEVIRVSTDLNFKFYAVTICVQSTVWQLKAFDESAGQWFVTTGGVEGKPGRETLSNWFKIEKCESDYKLVFCPTVCDFCKPLCRDIGIFNDDGVRRLALSDKPFKIYFKKV